jgi:hypothetical protein
VHLAIELARRCLVKARFEPDSAHRLENANRTKPGDFGGVFGDIEAHTHVALRPEVVHLVRAKISEDGGQRRSVVQVAVLQLEMGPLLVGIAVEMLEASRVEAG